MTILNSALNLQVTLEMYTLNLEVTLALTLFQSCRCENSLHSSCSSFQKRGLHSTCVFIDINFVINVGPLNEEKCFKLYRDINCYCTLIWKYKKYFDEKNTRVKYSLELQYLSTLLGRCLSITNTYH